MYKGYHVTCNLSWKKTKKQKQNKKKHAIAPSGSCLAWKPQNAPQVHNRWSHGEYHIHVKPTRVSFSFFITFFATTHRAQTEPKNKVDQYIKKN